jgi:hypothetical protein
MREAVTAAAAPERKEEEEIERRRKGTKYILKESKSQSTITIVMNK